MQTIEGPHGTTMLVDDPKTWAEKHAKYMAGLFRVKAVATLNRDGSYTVVSPGYDSLTFAKEKAVPVAPPEEAPTFQGPIHEPLRRFIPGGR